MPPTVASMEPTVATMRRVLLTALFVLVVGLGAACDGDADDVAAPATDAAPATQPSDGGVDTEPVVSTPETDTAPTETPSGLETTPARPAAALDGRAVYQKTGCGGCHGALAGGTKIAPALPGHAPKIIRRQVRAATGDMPSYTEEQLSPAELTAMIGWIGSLPVPRRHTEPVSIPQAVDSHYRMAFIALQFDDRKDALHHLGHVIASVKGTRLAAAKEVRALVRSNKLHDAEHTIQNILGAKHAAKLGSVEKLHLQVALGAALSRNLAQVRHHINHFLATAKGERRTAGRAILEAVADNDRRGAVDRIRALIARS